MKRLIAFALLSLCFQTSFGQSITIGFVSPRTSPPQLEGSNLSIQVIIFSTYTLSTVIANVNGRQTSLTYSQFIGRYTGTLSLVGLPSDTLNLQVIATDIQSNQQTANVKFIYQAPPLLIIDSPLDFSVATPLLHIKARCIDSNACSLNVSNSITNTPFSNGLNLNFGNSMDTSLDLSIYDGTNQIIVFTATDSKGQSTQVTEQIFVDKSPYLKQVFAGNDQIFDFNYNEALVSNYWWQGNSNTPDLNPYAFRTRIVNVLTGDSIHVPYSGPIIPGIGGCVLTPYGTLLSVIDTVTNSYSFVDWNAGSLYTFPYGVVVLDNLAGNYATWSNDSLLYLRNLQTATNTLVSSIGSSENQVASNGSVAYMANDHNIYRFANNISTLISNNAGDKWNNGPVTNGSNIVYNKVNPCCVDTCCVSPPWLLHLYNGQSDTLLSDMEVNFGLPPGSGPSISYSYQTNNNYVAYPKQDTAAFVQIWLRDSSGADIQETFSQNNNSIELLNSSGDLMFIRDSLGANPRRYFVRKSTRQTSRIGSSLGKVFYRDSTWYLTLGRMLYKIDVKNIPNAVMNSNINTPDSAYPFKTTDFIQNFTGYAPLTNVMITSLPKKGSLTINGAPVSANSQIMSDRLANLVYIPDPGFVGTDSLTWNGANGNNYTSGLATMILNISPGNLPHPLIAGGSNNYCGNQGVQKIKILNMPDTTTGTSVVVELDGKGLALSPDSSFSFNVSNLAPGIHEAEVTYSNIVGAPSLTDSFTVTVLVTPEVSVSSNISTVINLADPVIITASNAGGGGADPLYTFASDRGITTVLQAEGSSNTLTLNAGILTIGANWIYVRIRTSAACYTVQTNLDSVLIIRNPGNGITDPDFPAQPIDIFPNPFGQSINIDGLNDGKTYLITIHNAAGEKVYEQRVSNSQTLTLNQGMLQPGSYWLSIYDLKKNKLIGTRPVFKK